MFVPPIAIYQVAIIFNLLKGNSILYISDVQRMSLEVMTLQPVCDKVETIQGVPICVTGVAQVKIMKKHELLSVAAEQFLGKELREVHYTVLQTLEGHLRAILGTLTIEEIFQDREKFATQVCVLSILS